jgi:hypothetical protein
MRIICNGGCPDDVKCSAVVYDHRNELKDVDQDECTIRIVALEAESTLNHFVRKSNMPPESQCNQESSCSIEGAIACHRGEWRTRNKVHNMSFSVDTRICFELITGKFKLVPHHFVDILSVQGVMHHFCCSLHSK